MGILIFKFLIPSNRIHQLNFTTKILFDLRLLTKSLTLIGSAMFRATFNLVTRVRQPLFLEHWKIVVWKLML